MDKLYGRTIAQPKASEAHFAEKAGFGNATEMPARGLVLRRRNPSLELRETRKTWLGGSRSILLCPAWSCLETSVTLML